MGKTAFENLTRNSTYVADPTTDLRIVGGKRFLTGDEAGDIDTDDDASHALWQERRLKKPLKDGFPENIDAFGVIQPIVIAKLDGVATVVVGRSRVRAARIANVRRKARGEPPIAVECKIRRTDETGLMGAMIAENEQRTDNDILTKMDEARRYLARGVSEADVAMTFGIKTVTLKGWLAFDDNATPEVKAAVKAGRVSPTAAAELARTEPTKQNEALTSLLLAPGKKTVTAARKAVKKSTGGKSTDVGITSRRMIKAILDQVVATSHPNAGEKTLAWWQGVEDALKMIAGEEVEERLAKILTTVDA